MSLDPNIIRESFEAAKPHVTQIIIKFYATLFEDYPASKGLFEKVDMPKQRAALAGAISYVVENLENTAKVVDFLKKAGARHISYGTEEEYYDWVGASLLKAFAAVLGDAWTPEYNNQWTAAYGVIANTMIEGAREANAKRSGTGDSPQAQKPQPQPQQQNNVVPIEASKQGGGSSKIELPASIIKEIQTAVRAQFQAAVQAAITDAVEAESKNFKLEDYAPDLLKKVG